MLLAHRPVPAENLKDLVGLAKAQPGKINFGSAGVGSAPHLAGEQLRRAAGIDINHVPYKGGGPLVNDLLAGHLQLGFTTVPTMVEHVRAGTVRAIAVTGGAREPVAQPADRNGFYADRQHRRRVQAAHRARDRQVERSHQGGKHSAGKLIGGPMVTVTRAHDRAGCLLLCALSYRIK